VETNSFKIVCMMTAVEIIVMKEDKTLNWATLEPDSEADKPPQFQDKTPEQIAEARQKYEQKQKRKEEKQKKKMEDMKDELDEWGKTQEHIEEQKKKWEDAGWDLAIKEHEEEKARKKKKEEEVKRQLEELGGVENRPLTSDELKSKTAEFESKAANDDEKRRVIKLVNEWKEEGNRLLALGMHIAARQCYDEALSAVLGGEGPSECTNTQTDTQRHQVSEANARLTEGMRNLAAIVLSNKALAFLKDKDASGACAAANHALVVSKGKFAKAWFRRGQAKLEDDIFIAFYDWTEADSIKPGDPTLERELPKMEREITRLGNDYLKTKVQHDLNTLRVLDLKGKGQKDFTGDPEKDRNLESLFLANRKLDPCFCMLLRIVLANNATVKTLNISNTPIGAWGTQQICRGLSHNTTMKTLDLSGCYIRRFGAESVGNLLFEGAPLAHLVLTHNGIGDVGVSTLISRAMKDPPPAAALETVHLCHNRGGELTLNALSEVLLDNRYPSLREISICGCVVSLQALEEKLVPALKANTHLVRLFMDHTNALSVEEVERFISQAVSSVRYHPKLKLLSMRGLTGGKPLSTVYAGKLKRLRADGCAILVGGGEDEGLKPLRECSCTSAPKSCWDRLGLF